MTLFGSSTRLTFFITSKPPPSSCGTRSTSPARQEPWQALIEPPCANRHRGDVALGLHPGLPRLVVEPLLPDADVDLGEVVAPRLERAVGVGEHPPVVEHREPLAAVRLTIACHCSRTAGSCDQWIDASSQCQLIGTTWPLRQPPVQRRRVAVVAGRPVALRDLVAEVLAAECPCRSAGSAWRPAAPRRRCRKARRPRRTGRRRAAGCRPRRRGAGSRASTRRTAPRRRASPDPSGRARRWTASPLVVRVREERGELGLRTGHELEVASVTMPSVPWWPMNRCLSW